MAVFLSTFSILSKSLNQTFFLSFFTFVCPQSDQIIWECQQQRRCLTFQANLGWATFHYYGPSRMTFPHTSDWPMHVFISFSKVQHGFPGPPLAGSVHELEPSSKGLLEQNSYSNIPNDGKQHTPLYERLSPINPNHSGTSNHTDPAFCTTSSTSSSSENEENTGSTAKWVKRLKPLQKVFFWFHCCFDADKSYTRSWIYLY